MFFLYLAIETWINQIQEIEMSSKNIIFAFIIIHIAKISGNIMVNLLKCVISLYGFIESFGNIKNQMGVVHGFMDDVV